MNPRILRAGLPIALLALCLAALTGCKKEQASAGDEVELFAQAQELQKNEKYEDAVRIYRGIIRKFPKTRQAANSQFMIGYVYANHIKDFEQARIELNRFIDDFGAAADSGLVAGARFELMYLGKEIDEIPILSNLKQADTSAAVADTAEWD